MSFLTCFPRPVSRPFTCAARPRRCPVTWVAGFGGILQPSCCGAPMIAQPLPQGVHHDELHLRRMRRLAEEHPALQVTTSQ